MSNTTSKIQNFYCIKKEALKYVIETPKNRQTISKTEKKKVSQFHVIDRMNTHYKNRRKKTYNQVQVIEWVTQLSPSWKIF